MEKEIVFIDTHCHLDDPRYDDDLDEVLLKAQEAGIKKIIIPGADPRTLQKACALSQRYEQIYFAAGVHPYDIDRYDRSYIEQFLSHPKCVAVGECGLDYFRLPKDQTQQEAIKERQKEVFIDQINLAKAYRLPLIVHVRESSIDSLNLLTAHAGISGGVLHCYNAHEGLLDLVQKGFYFGIGGVLTFKNAKKLPQVLLRIPKDRIILETDAPYLTPHPHRGKRNEPSYIPLIAQKIAQLTSDTVESVAHYTTHNASILFNFQENVAS